MKKNKLLKISLTPLIIICCLLLFATCATKPAANPDEVSLNTAIREAAARMESRLDRGTKIALINFTSPSQVFSEYVLDELSSVLVNNGHLTVVDRASLDRVRQELNFNMSGEVSDESAQAIGHMLGAQAIVTGSLTSIGDLRSDVLHRVMFKTIITETAAVVVQHNADITSDRRVQALLASDARASAGGASQPLAYSGQVSAGSNTLPDGTNSQTTPMSAQPAAAVTYRIGDVGPAGGLIFYDKGNTTGGWQYMEAAPADISGMVRWNAGTIDHFSRDFFIILGIDSGQVFRVGRGKENTELLMEVLLMEGGGFGWALRRCYDFELNGFDDWFLPSRDELNFMYGNLHLRDLGSFSNDWYWTSSVDRRNADVQDIWRINFADNRHEADYFSRGMARVRPVRRF